jgi:DNA polymerase III delta prime subunit
MSINISLQEKYRPKKLDDLFISDNNKKKVKTWIDDFIKKKKKFSNCLLIHGPPGVGKTSLASLIFNSYDFDIIEYNASFIRNAKGLKEELDKINGNINILDFMTQKKEKKKIAIIIDELDGIGNTDKGTLNELITIIVQSNKMKNGGSPFICITNTINKKIDSLKKKSVYIKIDKPSRFLCQKLLTKINIKENFNLDSDNFNRIIDICQLDFRRLINILDYIQSNIINYDSNTISNIINSFEKKNIDNTIIDASFKILNKYNDNLEEYYNTDKTMVGYYIFENFTNFIINNCNEKDNKKWDIITKIYALYSMGDLIDYEIFINQNFVLYSYNYFFKCKYTSYYINSLNRYSINKLNSLNYSTLINKNSLEYLNYKILSEIKEKVIYNDYNNICDIIIYYLLNNIENIKIIIKYYNIDEELLKKIIKYSKYELIIKDYKNTFKLLFN